jgi:predicted RNA-binding Zn ribbon-like protein
VPEEPEGVPQHFRLVHAFLNTVDFDTNTERLPDAASTRAWFAERGLDLPPMTEEENARLRSFREALRTVLESNAGHGDAAAAWRELDPFLASARLRLGGSPPKLLPAEGDAVAQAAARLTADLYEGMLGGTFPRLKVCGRSSCRWAFYDASKNGSGRWCSMAGCGNREKAQRRRQRQKA